MFAESPRSAAISELRQCVLVFRDWHLTIESALPEVVASCQHQFRHLIGSSTSRRSAGALHVSWSVDAGSYVIGRLRSTDQPSTGTTAETCDPVYANDVATMCRLLGQAIISSFMQVSPELLWVHAAGLVRHGRAVLLVGSLGQGKSTLAAAMIREGWSYLSDDVVPLDSLQGYAWPFPRTPFQRVASETELSHDEVSSLSKAEVPLAPSQICQEAQSVAAMIFPVWQFKAESRLRGKPAGRAALALIENCMNFPVHRRAAVRLAARLLTAIPAYDLIFSEAEDAVPLISEHALTSVEPLAIPI